jgi:nucleotide-binding universal stress UspA family protein
METPVVRAWENCEESNWEYVDAPDTTAWRKRHVDNFYAGDFDRGITVVRADTAAAREEWATIKMRWEDDYPQTDEDGNIVPPVLDESEWVVAWRTKMKEQQDADTLSVIGCPVGKVVWKAMSAGDFIVAKKHCFLEWDDTEDTLNAKAAAETDPEARELLQGAAKLAANHGSVLAGAHFPDPHAAIVRAHVRHMDGNDMDMLLETSSHTYSLGFGTS